MTEKKQKNPSKEELEAMEKKAVEVIAGLKKQLIQKGLTEMQALATILSSASVAACHLTGDGSCAK